MTNTKISLYILMVMVFCVVSPKKVMVGAQPQTEPATQTIFSESVSPNKLKADLDFLFRTIEEVHPNMYAYTSREEFVAYRDELYRRITQPMTRVEFYKEVAPAVAKLKNGHTYVYPFVKEFQKHVKSGGKIYPICLSVVGEDVILAKNCGMEDLPVGGKVLQIEGVDARETAMRYASYIAAECRDSNPNILSRSKVFWSLLWLEHGDTKALNIRIRDATGREKDYSVKPIAFKKAMERETTTASAKEEPYAYRRLPDSSTGLMKIRYFNDPKKVGSFLDQTFEDIKEQEIQSLIIDIRGNPGGNSMVADALLRFLTCKPIRQFDEFGIKFSKQYCKAKPGVLEQFQKHLLGKNLKEGSFFRAKAKDFPIESPNPANPLRFNGQTFVLIDGLVASTSVSFASAIRGHGVGKLIGTETMDTTSLYGECFPVTLPNTGMLVSISCKYFVCAGGKDDQRGLLPDYEVKQKQEDTVRGVDTVMQFTLELIGKE